MIAGRSAVGEQAGHLGHLVGVGLDHLRPHRVGQLDTAFRRPEHVEREVEEHRAAVRGHGRRRRLVHLLGRRSPLCTVPADFVTDGDDRHVVQLLQRARPPAPLRRPAAEHHERRAVEPGRGDGRHAVGDAGAGREHGQPRRAGQLGVGLGGEGGRLLVAGVDHPHALVAGRLVERPDMAAVQREHHVDPERPQGGQGLLARVPGEALRHGASLADRPHRAPLRQVGPGLARESDPTAVTDTPLRFDLRRTGRDRGAAGPRQGHVRPLVATPARRALKWADRPVRRPARAAAPARR